MIDVVRDVRMRLTLGNRIDHLGDARAMQKMMADFRSRRLIA
jgi:hypothetical protein